ncbi:TniQ family protein [uncultured Aureimonas sp.]|uniref:TniQ family protein n=1 Tax=uncultured Aureimonas sp. TaxID=1604662 RepID=UPI0025D3C781|nr:TniQ family protein [uncultured Aureimonas sp.]
MRLAFELRQGESEMPSDFASRLAHRCCRDDLRDFCGDFALDYQRIVDGDALAVDRLADLAGADAARLKAEAFVRTTVPHRYVHKDETLVRRNLARDRVRVCPACLAEDVTRHEVRLSARPWRRSEWIVLAVRTCPAHELALVDLGVDSLPARSHDTSRALAGALPHLDKLIASTTRRGPSPFETYVRGRLAGRSSSPWLDALPLHAALRLTGVVGAVDVHGPGVALTSLDADAYWESEAAGFAILDRGETGLRDLLERLQQKFVRGRTTWGPKAMYGRLYEWLAHESDDPAYEPMRSLMVTHAAETLPVGPDDEMFGRAFPTRRFHSIHSVSLESGLHPKRLRKLLRERGLIEADAGLSDDRVMIDAQVAEEFVSTIAGTMSLKQAAAYLGIPRPLDRELVAAGYIRPMIRGGGDALGSHAFRRTDLDAFSASLRERADRGIVPDTRMATIPKAARIACCDSIRILRLLLDGRLERVAAGDDERGFLSVLVDVDEIRPHVVRPDHGGMTLREVERELVTSTKVVANLIDLGLMAASTVPNPVTNAPQRVVTRDELARFRREYVLLHGLAASRGVHSLRVKKELAAAGVEPVVERSVLDATLYRRSDIP